MIINEPKTPFNRLGIPENEEDEEKDERQQLLDRLKELEIAQKKSVKPHIGFASAEESSKSADYQEKHEMFLKKRKLHYNEYQEVLRMRELHREGEDDDNLE